MSEELVAEIRRYLTGRVDPDNVLSPVARGHRGAMVLLTDAVAALAEAQRQVATVTSQLRDAEVDRDEMSRLIVQQHVAARVREEDQKILDVIGKHGCDCMSDAPCDGSCLGGQIERLVKARSIPTGPEALAEVRREAGAEVMMALYRESERYQHGGGNSLSYIAAFAKAEEIVRTALGLGPTHDTTKGEG